MNITELFNIISESKGFDLDNNQKEVVQHGEGPLWVVAGPGSGKTEVLVLRTLKLIYVDNFSPSSIIITTFTEKAAKNLFERILNYTSLIIKEYPELESIDIHNLKIGTLHSLCNDIMLENKYPDYENYRLLDEMEQYLFIYEHSDFVKDKSDDYMPLCNHFSYLFDRFDGVTGSFKWNREKMPNKWRRTNAAIKIFNRIVEDMVDIEKMENSEAHWKLLHQAYNDYYTKMIEHRRCDFSHLQKKFLEFLESPLGQRFLEGDGTETHPGIRYVLVDEYQDTNPIQEMIYLSLAKNSHNLCVVGDDDQALYRFRGGTVDCMVTFKEACENAFNLKFSSDSIKFLNSNYRSHPNIVYYYDDYINSFDAMNLEKARVENKPPLNPKGSISGDYPAVAFITGKTINETAENFALFVDDLLKNEIIEKPSQCALLMRSVRETARNAGPFAESLRNLGINVYNPRSKGFLEQEEIAGALGAFVSIVDPDLSGLNAVGPSKIKETVHNWVEVYKEFSSDYPEIEKYVEQSVENISKVEESKWIGVNILDIFYRILAHDPFNQWRDDPEKTYRLGKLSKIFETYSAVPFPDHPGSERGQLRTSSVESGNVSFAWRLNFYYSLIALLVSSGLDDPENETLLFPPDRLPIMTVHQSKGLEFPFVFVYGLNHKPKPDDSILLEDAFLEFRKNPPFVNFTPEERAEQDIVRFYFVAYSRAQYALIHIVPKAHLKDKAGYGIISRNKKLFENKAEKVEG